MKIKLLGKNLTEISPLLDRYGMHDCGDDTPELIVVYGGDGSLLGAQRCYPDIPKLAMRDAATAPVCSGHTAEKVIQDFIAGNLKKNLVPKLKASAGSADICGINDLVIHSMEYTSALRCRVFINEKLYASEVICDGICLAGVHGSTAYYRSITRTSFSTGIGVAFSNPTELVGNPVLPADSVVKVQIIRGPGILMADNDPRKIKVDVGEYITMCQTEEYAEIWGLDGFMCRTCRQKRHSRKFYDIK